MYKNLTSFLASLGNKIVLVVMRKHSRISSRLKFFLKFQVPGFCLQLETCCKHVVGQRWAGTLGIPLGGCASRGTVGCRIKWDDVGLVQNARF